MKKCLFILISLLSTGFAYAQLSMKVDSIDISKNIDILFDRGRLIWTCDDGRPILHITVVVSNNLDHHVSLYSDGTPSSFWLDYQINGRNYHDKLEWLNQNEPVHPGPVYESYYDINLVPFQTKKLLFVTHISEDDILFKDPKAVKWKWDRDPMADSEYIDWLKGILPTMRIIIYYEQWNDNATKKLVSEPINLETLKITTNLKDERVN